MAHRRLTFTLPPDVVSDLDYISKRVSISRSSLLGNLIAEPAHDLRTLLESVPDNPTDEDIIRARGASDVLIKERLSAIKGLEEDDLFGV